MWYFPVSEKKLVIKLQNLRGKINSDEKKNICQENSSDFFESFSLKLTEASIHVSNITSQSIRFNNLARTAFFLSFLSVFFPFLYFITFSFIFLSPVLDRLLRGEILKKGERMRARFAKVVVSRFAQQSAIIRGYRCTDAKGDEGEWCERAGAGMKRRAGEAAMVERSANTICRMGMRISILSATKHFHYLLLKLFIHSLCYVCNVFTRRLSLFSQGNFL